MSSDASKKNSRPTLAQEVREVVADVSPIAFFPRMIGIDHLNKMLGAARSRVNDSHKVQHAVLVRESGVADTLEEANQETTQETGEETMPAGDPGEEMSNFSVAGDTHYHVSSEKNNTGGKPPSLAAKAMQLALAAALGGSGAWLLAERMLPPVVAPAVERANDLWGLELQVTDRP